MLGVFGYFTYEARKREVCKLLQQLAIQELLTNSEIKVLCITILQPCIHCNDRVFVNYCCCYYGGVARNERLLVFLYGKAKKMDVVASLRKIGAHLMI